MLKDLEGVKRQGNDDFTKKLERKQWKEIHPVTVPEKAPILSPLRWSVYLCFSYGFQL